MKKLFIGFICFCCAVLLFMPKAIAVETMVSGTGKAALSGYDIGATRSQEDEYMANKARNSKTEIMHAQQIKEASRQAEKRKKEDKRLSGAVRTAVVTAARERAEQNAINVLIDKVLGVNASKNPHVIEKFEDLFSQADTYIIDRVYSGEVIDNNYVAKAKLTVDETSFRELISDLGFALNTENVRSQSILLVMDEFFVAPSDMHTNVLTKEVTTYKYDYDEKLKDHESASASSYDSKKSSGASSNTYNVNAKSKGNYKANASGGYSNAYGGGGYSGSAGGSHNNSYKANGSSSNKYNNSEVSSSKANYGHFVDYSQKESEFFQNIKEYAPRNPQAQNLNYTQPALVEAFNRADIKTIDNDLFKSRYFKGNPITADKLTNSEELSKYVKYAQTDAKADFFAIGVSYITDNGVDQSTGKKTCDGQVFLKVYSTQTGELIASGSITDTSFGNTSDQARVAVANKIAPELGDALSKQIQNYYKKRNMYGNEFTLEIKGNFLPAEKAMIGNALSSCEGVKKVSPKVLGTDSLEYQVIYTGNGTASDAIFMQLIKASAKFNNYDYKLNRNQIIFEPLKGNNNL